MRIYVGNLAYGTDEDTLRQAFEAFGEVESVNIIKDRETNRSKGFGFVAMTSDEEGTAAIEQLDGTEIGGRTLRISKARPREERPPRRF